MASYGIRITNPFPALGQFQYDGTLNDLILAIVDVLASQVTPDGILINASLDMHGNHLINCDRVGFSAVASAPTVGPCLYINAAGDIHYVNAANVDVQISSGGTLAITTVGAIGGDYVAANAHLNFVSATNTYTFTDSLSAPSNITVNNVAAANVVSTTTVDAPQVRASVLTQLSGTVATANNINLSISATGSMTLNGLMTGSSVQDAKWSVPGRWVNRQVFTATGAYTPGKDVRSLMIRMVGGGGAGGGAGSTTSAQGSAGGGGASGVYIEDFRLVAPISGNVYIGAAGAGSSNAAGGVGGDTLLRITGSNGNYVYTSPGGKGGSVAIAFATPSIGPGGGVGSAASLTIGGGAATLNVTGIQEEGLPGINWLGDTSVVYSGAGGSNPLGGGGGTIVYVGAVSGSASPGKPAQGYGGGGGGAAAQTAGGANAGGSGGPGIVIIDEFR